MKLFKHKRPIIIILIALLFLFAAKAYYDTHSIEIRHYEIKNSSLREALDGLKVAHLSDLHLKSIGLRENKILEILTEEKPDLILITGDLISFEGPYEPVMSFLRQLKPPYGIYGVLGNTEYSNENGSCIL
jgi:predicted MPP superfamily phosphohydrolase